MSKFGSDPSLQPFLPETIKAIDAADEDIARAQRSAAKPRPHTFALVPKR